MFDHSASAAPAGGDVARQRRFIVALAALCAVYLALFFYFVARAFIRVPVYDLLDWLWFYGESARGSDLFGYLWSPHNEHRLVLTRILIAVDYGWLGGTGLVFAAFASLLLLTLIWAICRMIARSALSCSGKAALILMTIFLSTPANIVVMIGMPAMGANLYTAAFAAFSLLLLADVATSPAPLRIAAVIGCACLAAFGSSSGLLIWPALLWLGWQNGVGRTWLIATIMAGVAFGFSYLWHLHTVSVSIPLTVDHLAMMFDYAIRFLGLPWSHLPQLVWPARAIGVFILCAGLYLLARHHFSEGVTTRLERLGLALILFVFLIAGAAAVVRVDVAPDREMPIRYGIFMVLGHVGLLLSLSVRFDRLWSSRYRRVFQGAVGAVAIVLVVQQYVAGTFAAHEAARYNDAWDRFTAGEWTPDMLRYVYPDRDHAVQGLTALRAMKLIRGE